MVATTPAAETRRQHWTRLLGRYALAPLLALAALPVSVHILQKPDLGLAVHRTQVIAVAPDGPAARAGIQAGDHLLALDGVRIHRMVDWFAANAGNYSLDPRQLTVARTGENLTVTIEPRRPSRSRMVFGLSTWLTGLTFLLIGWWVLGRRHDAVGRDFFAMCLIFAFFLADIPDLPSRGYLELKQMLRELLQYLWPVYFLRFFLMFPATGRVRTVRLQRYLFVPAGLLIVLTLLAHLVGIAEESTAAGVLQGAAQLHFLIFFVLGLVVFARKVLRRDRPILHTKLRVILLGLLGGLVPFLVAVAVGGGLLPSFPHWEYLGFSLLLVPVSFGLAIMRYGALDTAFVVRTSLVYGLLTLAILTAYIVLAGIMGTLVTRTFQVSAYPVLVVVIAASSLSVLPLRRRVQGVVDATFYPSRRANREAIANLGRSLAVQVSAEEAHSMLLARLHHLYRPRWLALYLAGNAEADALVDVGRMPADQTRGPDLLRDDPAVAFLDRLRRPVFREEFEDWAGPALGGPGTRTALPLNTELLVPLITGNRLLGLLACGPKASGSLYSQEDLANLANLALQTAPVLESLRLYAESLRRRQLETELTVARDIQAQLLPTEPLNTGTVRICGRNDPCRQVGGDYYDYFPLVPEHSLGFCIADVAGKGIPAALMMTTVRVTFRELAQPGVNPETVIGALDRRMGEVLTAGRFVCFFYAVLDLRSGLLTYCNAGLEPPLLLHADGRREPLRRGGPVIGIGAGVPYRRGTVRLQPGDMILGYTDGITEQTSPDGQEFFEIERLEAMAANAHMGTPEHLCDQIFTSVEEFGGAAVSDDRTVIVLKYR